jgi:hypothetical protein
MTRKYEQNGFTFIIEHVADEMTPETPEDQQTNYDGCSDEEKAQYLAEDTERYEAWKRDEWYYMGIVCTIRKNTTTHWADGGLEVGRASVWGIESDSDDSFIRATEEEMVDRALAEVELLKVALASLRKEETK